MSWSRGSLLVALLALPVPFAMADTVIVNTTADDSSSSTCSFRDAVKYLSIPAADRLASDANGCSREGDATESDIVKLPYNASAYVIEAAKGPIEIDSSITVTGEQSTDTVPRSPFVWVKASQGFKVDGPDLTADLGTVDARLDLAPGSDTNVVGDRHTSDRLPFFIGTTTPGTTICLFRQGPGQTDYVPITSGVSDASSGQWSFRTALMMGIGITTIALKEGSADCSTLTGAPDRTIKISVYKTSAVTFNFVDVVGCDAANLPSYMTTANVVPAACSVPVAGSKGGLFYNNEHLDLETAIVRGGRAERGGIIYVGKGGALVVSESALLNGRASEGAAVYLERSSIQLSRSLVAGNVGATEAIKIATGDLVSGVAGSTFESSTFHHNDGVALSVHENVKLNAVTIVENVAGAIQFSGADLTAATSNILVFNSIVSGACAGAPGTWPVDNTPKFNMADSSCSFLDATNTTEDGPIVAVVNADKSCQGVATGILCPRDSNGDGVIDFYSPRYLPSLVPGVDPVDQFSRLINKGSINNTASACPSQDQRGESRDQAGRCDIGAVEFKYVSTGLNSGGFIVSGSYTQTFDSDLVEDSDEELYLPSDPTICPVVLPSAPLSGAAGSCPWLSVAPGKGTVTLTADRKGYIYTPFYQFHGSDTFRIEITTTASRLNDYSHPTSRTRGIVATISSEPASGLQSDSLLNGGAFDWFGLVGLTALLSHRRIRKGATRV